MCVEVNSSDSIYLLIFFCLNRVMLSNLSYIIKIKYNYLTKKEFRKLNLNSSNIYSSKNKKS
jgi:hypothetical protein